MRDKYGLKIRDEQPGSINKLRSTNETLRQLTEPEEIWSSAKAPCENTGWLPYTENEKGEKAVFLPSTCGAGPVILTPGYSLLHEEKQKGNFLEHRYNIIRPDGEKILLSISYTGK